jgi:hypothetical protein
VSGIQYSILAALLSKKSDPIFPTALEVQMNMMMAYVIKNISNNVIEFYFWWC